MFIIHDRFLFIDAKTGDIKHKCDTDVDGIKYINTLKKSGAAMENLFIVDQNMTFKPLPVLVWHFDSEVEE